MKPLTPAPGMRNADPRWPDAQPFMPDVEYVKKGATINTTEAGVQRTILGNGDVFYGIDTSGGNVTLTLPTVGDELGRTHTVKRLTDGTNACTIVTAEGTAILDHSATHSIAFQDGVRSYFSDGSRWRSTTVVAGENAEAAGGVYTPTLTGDTNVSATGAVECHYMRLGSEVTVAGGLTINPTAVGALTDVDISLPVASDFAQTYDCSGMGFRVQAGNVVTVAGGIFADTTNNRATLRFLSSATSTNTWNFNFTYRIR